MSGQLGGCFTRTQIKDVMGEIHHLRNGSAELAQLDWRLDYYNGVITELDNLIHNPEADIEALAKMSVQIREHIVAIEALVREVRAHIGPLTLGLRT